MARALAAACVFLAATAACAVDPFGGEQGAPVVLPNAVGFSWRGFEVQLEPTVVLWGREAHIDVRGIVRRTLVDVEGRLQGHPTRIEIHAGSYRTIPDIGIGGLTDPVTGQLQVTMDQRSPVGLRQLLTVWLPLSLAHELHHSKRILDGPGYGNTLLEAMVTEGGAESFVEEVFPQHPVVPWVQTLPVAQQRRVWQRAQSVLRRSDDLDLHEEWFYGRAGLPRWAGYKLGFAIVEAYRARHPNVTGADLATLSADAIFSGSSYRPS